MRIPFLSYIGNYTTETPINEQKKVAEVFPEKQPGRAEFRDKGTLPDTIFLTRSTKPPPNALRPIRYCWNLNEEDFRIDSIELCHGINGYQIKQTIFSEALMKSRLH